MGIIERSNGVLGVVLNICVSIVIYPLQLPHFDPLGTTRAQGGNHSHHTDVAIVPAMLV